jgi:hypothetical protein
LHNISNSAFRFGKADRECSELEEWNHTFACPDILFDDSGVDVRIMTAAIKVVGRDQIATNVLFFVRPVRSNVGEIVGVKRFAGWVVKNADGKGSDATFGLGKQAYLDTCRQCVDQFGRLFGAGRCRDQVFFIVKRYIGGCEMATKHRFHVFFDEGVQDGVVGDVKALQKFDEIFCICVIEVVKVDGFDLDGVCEFVFAGEHLDFAICSKKHVMIIV